MAKPSRKPDHLARLSVYAAITVSTRPVNPQFTRSNVLDNQPPIPSIIILRSGYRKAGKRPPIQSNSRIVNER